MLREVLDQVPERRVRHLRLVGPRRVAKYPSQAFWVGCLDGAERASQCPADIPCRSADVGPVCAGRDDEPVVGSRLRVALVAGLVEGVPEFFVPDVGEALEEEQREDVLLIVPGVDQAAQEVRGTPEVRLQRLLAQVFGGSALVRHLSGLRVRNQTRRCHVLGSRDWCTTAMTSIHSGRTR